MDFSAKRCLSSALCGLTVTVLVGCAAPSTQDVPQVRDARGLVTFRTDSACEFILNIAQKEVAIERHVPASSTSPSYHGPGWGYAFLGRMMDSAIAASRDAAAERDIVPIRKALANQDINAKFLQALANRSTQLPCKVAGSVRPLALLTRSEAAQAIRASSNPYVLLVAVEYSMSPDSRYLTAQAFTALVPRTGGSDDNFLEHAVYAGQLQYTKKVDNFGDVNELNRIWLADGAGRLYQAVDEIADGVAMLLVLDVGAGRSNSLTGAPGERMQIPMRGRVLEVVRDPRGALQVVTD